MDIFGRLEYIIYLYLVRICLNKHLNDNTKKNKLRQMTATHFKFDFLQFCCLFREKGIHTHNTRRKSKRMKWNWTFIVIYLQYAVRHTKSDSSKQNNILTAVLAGHTTDENKFRINFSTVNGIIWIFVFVCFVSFRSRFFAIQSVSVYIVRWFHWQ